MKEIEEPTKLLTCGSHDHYEAMLEEVRRATRGIEEGQTEIRMTLIKLTEHMKGLERLEVRVDKLEVRHERDEKEARKEIDRLKGFMYRIVGAVGVISLLAPILVKVLLVLLL